MSANGSNSLTTTTTSMRAQLSVEDIITLLLSPDLEDSFTPGALLGASNVAIFNLLPLILAAIQTLGNRPTHRPCFVKLVSVLRMRIVACRGLKLRFLLLIKNAAFSEHWLVRLVHRRDCYNSARHVLDDVSRDMASQDATSRSLALAQKLSQVDVAGSKLVAGWLEDDNLLIAFAARKVLHPEYGIRRRTITWHVRPIKAAFFATELVDGIMERANFRNRDDAICLAQRLLDHGIIFKIGGHRNKFSDDRRRIYQCRITMHRDDAGHCRVVTDAGKEITSWDVVQDHCSVAIKQIEIQIPMDMIDLQSYEFWTHSVYVRGVERGFRYGYRAITHPLYCTGKDAQGELDYSEVTKDMDTESLTDSASNGSDGIGSDVLLSRKTTSSGISTDEINSLQQEAAVVGSVVVRKVFSSIARPMIVELRVPLENADLDDDDHHIVLPPGVLVKEGDNLMQDLGVEIMFQCFNHVWQHSALIKSKYKQPPFSLSYEVFPTSATQGFMEAVTGLESLKEYNWQAWREKYGDDPERVDAMVRSTVGSYIGAYVCGGRDRHFDNVLVKDDLHLLHIDFGFLMGTSPPIDGPRIAIAPQMEVVFRELKVWDRFVDMSVDAFMALRAEAPAIIRTSVMIFSKAGYEEDQIRAFVQGKFSLHVHGKDKKAADFVRRQMMMSSGDIKTWFKQFAHEHIDPAWYGLLEKGFPPAVAIMKLVDAKEQKAAKKLSQTGKNSAEVSDEQKIHL